MLKGEMPHAAMPGGGTPSTAATASPARRRPFEFFTCNPARGSTETIMGQLPENQREDRKPPYMMVKAGRCSDDTVQLHRFFGWDSVKIKDGT